MWRLMVQLNLAAPLSSTFYLPVREFGFHFHAPPRRAGVATPASARIDRCRALGATNFFAAPQSKHAKNEIFSNAQQHKKIIRCVKSYLANNGLQTKIRFHLSSPYENWCRVQVPLATPALIATVVCALAENENAIL